MKKVILSLGLMAFLVIGKSYASDEYEYTCYKIVDGKITGSYVKVKAKDEKEAEKKAYKKYKEELGINVEGVKCKYYYF